MSSLYRAQNKIRIYVFTAWFRMGMIMVKEIVMLWKVVGFHAF